MTRQNSGGEIIRFAAAREKSGALNGGAGQENSIPSISGNNYAFATIQETYHLGLLMKS